MINDPPGTINTTSPVVASNGSPARRRRLSPSKYDLSNTKYDRSLSPSKYERNLSPSKNDRNNSTSKNERNISTTKNDRNLSPSKTSRTNKEYDNSTPQKSNRKDKSVDNSQRKISHNDRPSIQQSRDDVDTFSKEENQGTTEKSRSNRKSGKGSFVIMTVPTNRRSSSALEIMRSESDTNGAESVAFSPRATAFSGTRSSNGSRGTSPRRALQLVLPPPDNRYSPLLSTSDHSLNNNDQKIDNDKYEFTLPSSTAAIQATIAAKSTYLTRKAHRFSNMKKSKPNSQDRPQKSSFLLSRLFCAPLELGNGNGHDKVTSSSAFFFSGPTSPPNVHDIIDGMDGQRQNSHSVVQQILDLSSTPRKGSNTGIEPTSLQKMSDEKNQPRRSQSKQSATSPMSQNSTDSSVTSFANAFMQASEKISLETEIQLRKTMRGGIQEVFLEACVSGSGSSTVAKTQKSPPTYSTSGNDSSNNNKDGFTDSNRRKDTNHFTLGQNHNLLRGETGVANEESTEIELRDNQNLLQLIVDDNILQESGSGSPIRFIQAPELSPSETTSGAVRNPTVKQNEQNSSVDSSKREIPGKLVIPPRFLSASLHSLTEQLFTRSSSSSPSSLDDKKQQIDFSTEASFGATVMKSAIAALKREGSSSDNEDRNVASLFGVTRVELARATRGLSPPPMVRLTSSLEDLATVPEATTSRETATVLSQDSDLDDQSSFGHFGDGKQSQDVDGEEVIVFESGVSNQTRSAFPNSTSGTSSLERKKRLYTHHELEQHLTDAVQKAKQQWHNNFFGTYLSGNLQNHNAQTDPGDLERKNKELKDQIVLANRLAKHRLEEIEQLENKVKHFETQTASSPNDSEAINEEIMRLNDEIKKLKSDRDAKDEIDSASVLHEAEFDRQTKELERVKSQLSDKENELSTTKESQNLMLFELTEVKSKLMEKEKEVDTKARGELNRARKELMELKAQLANQEREFRSRTPPKEIQRLQKELGAVKKQLAEKELQLSNQMFKTNDSTSGRFGSPLFENKSILISEMNGVTDIEHDDGKQELDQLRQCLSEKISELELVKKEYNAYKNTPGRRGRMIMKSTNRRSWGQFQLDNQKDSEENQEGLLEIYEKEKEGLLKEIDLLNQQASQASEEHENALSELRKASEAEIELVKKDMESRLAHHLEKERNLKQSITSVSLNEKEALLQQIERLELEKRSERHGGLREVQRKEELLERIAQLEKKHKEAVEEHERVMQDLRIASESEIHRLREEMGNRIEEQTARERELQNAISDTSSYEKEDLLDRIDRLQSQLESERSGTILLQIKMANVEKEAAVTANMHQVNIETLELTKDLQIKALQDELQRRRVAKETEKEFLEKEQSYQTMIDTLKREKAIQQQQLEKYSDTQTQCQSSEQSGRSENDENGTISNNEQLSAVNDELLLEKNKLLRDLEEAIEGKKELEHQLKLTEIQKHAIEKEMVVVEKLHSEKLERLRLEQDRAIERLRTRHENESIPDSENESDVLKDEIMSLKRKLGEEQERRQRIINELKNEHTRALNSMKQASSERYWQMQQEAEERIQNAQKVIEDKYQSQVAQANDQLSILQQEYTTARKSMQMDLDASQTRVTEMTKHLQDKVIMLEAKLEQTKRDAEEDHNRLNKQVQEKKDFYNRRLQEVEQNFFIQKRRLQEELAVQIEKKEHLEVKMEEKFKKDIKAYEQKSSFERKRLLDQIDTLKLQQKVEDKSNDEWVAEKDKEVTERVVLVERQFRQIQIDLINQLEKEKSLRKEEQTRMEAEEQKRYNDFEQKVLLEKEGFERIAEDEKQKLKNDHLTVVKTYEGQLVMLNEQIQHFESQIVTMSLTVDEKAKEKVRSMEEMIALDKAALIGQVERLMSDKANIESQMKSVQQEHAKELDELLSQLDLVEAEHQGILVQKEKIITDREMTISTLETQILEAQKRTGVLEQKLAEQYEIVERALLRSKAAEEALGRYKKELQSAKDAHCQFVIEAEVIRSKACEEAREEMIERAERQFQQANDHYVKLRKQFDLAQTHITKLENRVKDSIRRVEIVQKEKDRVEINAKAEIAQLLADKAKYDADTAQATREYRREIDKSMDRINELEKQFHIAETTSRNIQTTLATVVSEKEKLKKEYDDMKNVSEELMAIIEGQEQHQQQPNHQQKQTNQQKQLQHYSYHNSTS